jgi:hypothetical protein
MAKHIGLVQCGIWHKPKKENVVHDALNQKHQLKVVYVGETKLQKEVRVASRHDGLARK